MTNFKTLREKLHESKKAPPVETRVVKKTVHQVEYKDEFGRWMYHSTHDTEEDATKGLKSAVRSVRQDQRMKKSGKTDMIDTMKTRPKNHPHGDY